MEIEHKYFSSNSESSIPALIATTIRATYKRTVFSLSLSRITTSVIRPIANHNTQAKE